MPKFVVLGLASRSLTHPTAQNSLIITSEDKVFWKGELIGRVSVAHRLLVVQNWYRWCTLLINGSGPEGFGNSEPNEDTFMFRGNALVVLPRGVRAFYDPNAKALS